jgi:glycine cleavage system aminomethyltransferase T
MRIVVDGVPTSCRDGDSLAVAMLRAGSPPRDGGCLCLAGDCPHCLAEVEGVAYVRTCQTQARPGMVVRRQGHSAPAPPPAGSGTRLAITHEHCDLVVIGAGPSGQGGAAAARAQGRRTVVLDAREGIEAIGIYQGPLVVARARQEMLYVHAREVLVATGAAELQPSCSGADLAGLVTARAAERLAQAEVPLGRVVAVGEAPRGVACTSVAGWPLRFEGEHGRVVAVVVQAPDGTEQRLACDTVALGLGLTPRDVLARMGAGLPVGVVGAAAVEGSLPPPPREGIVCPCAGVTVDDLSSAWERGFHELELLKRATLVGTGTCQGAVCLPHLRSFVAARAGGPPPLPFTARPLARQVTIEEAAAGCHFAPVRRTTLDPEHRRLGARMDRFGGWWRPWSYGDFDGEYWAVREAVSVGDVGTLGKLDVTGPDAVELLERLYPCHVSDIAPGRARYALVLDERGYLLDDGLICREAERRFFLTFTTGGASFAEAWLRDWAETYELDVRILDRTASLGAINVTGPRAAELLARVGVAVRPAFMEHADVIAAGVPCRAIRLGFTGEASFELHHGADRSVELWRALLEAGVDLGIRPHGLEALLALRLEKGHIVHGLDTDLDSTPRRLGMEWAVRMGKGDFIGRQALERVDRLPLDRALVGLELEGPAPVDGDVLRLDGKLVGQVTSARWSPVLRRTVMLAWLRLVDGVLPGEVDVDGRRARRVPLPFYDREGARARS